MMRALLLTFTLVVLPGVLRCLPPPRPPPPGRIVVSRRHIFGTAGVSSSSSSSISSSSSSSSSSGLSMRRPGVAGGPDEVHLGSNDPVKTLHVQPDFLVILPLGTGASNTVSIFDWRLKQFLCMDLSGEVYGSKDVFLNAASKCPEDTEPLIAPDVQSEQNSEDCLFQHVWSDWKNRRRVLHSSSGSGLLLRLQTPEAQRSLGPHEEGPHPQTPEGYRPPTHRGGTRGHSSPHGGDRPHDHALLSSLLARLRRQPARRRRRSDLVSPVNPSDPLRSEPHHPQAHEDHHHHHHLLLLTPQEGGGGGGGAGTGAGVGGAGLNPGPPQPPPPRPAPEQEQPGAVSKETITSCDDPLRVLQQPNTPVSPVKTNLNMADEARSLQV